MGQAGSSALSPSDMMLLGEGVTSCPLRPTFQLQVGVPSHTHSYKHAGDSEEALLPLGVMRWGTGRRDNTRGEGEAGQTQAMSPPGRGAGSRRALGQVTE